MIDTSVERLIPLAEATKSIPPARNGRCTHISTLLRWILTGSKGPVGEVVRLEALRVGGRWMTSKESLQRFMERLTPNFDDTTRADAPRSTAQRKRASGRAAAQLEEIGI